METETILHTAGVNKDMKSLNSLLSSNTDTVELDFVMTRDGIPVWTHGLFPTQFNNFDSKTNRDMLTLYDVLDINNHRRKLMLDLKYIPGYILKSSKFNKLIEYLNSYDKMLIQSLDLNLLQKLKEYNYSNFEIGFIINVLSKGFIDSIKKISNLDFMAISSELWEKNNGAFIEKCKTLYPNIKKYAWTWATREETEDRINNFIDKGANGIITDKPSFVRALINNRK